MRHTLFFAGYKLPYVTVIGYQIQAYFITPKKIPNHITHHQTPIILPGKYKMLMKQ